MSRNTNTNTNTTLSRSQQLSVREIVEDVVREAITAQARDLEKHLRDLHERVSTLERSR